MEVWTNMRTRSTAAGSTAAMLLAALVALLPGAPAGAQTRVSSDWPLIPPEVGAGDTFRLLFVTSTEVQLNSDSIHHYNAFVQARAAAGHAAIQSHSSLFRVLASTAAVAARDNTGTNPGTDGPGEPIFWLGSGVRVADDYEDLYDGYWDSESWTTEAGGSGSDQALGILNGSTADGRSKPKWPFRNITTQGERVGGGKLNSGGMPMYSVDRGAGADGTLSTRVYALSSVFQVAPDTLGPGGIYVADAMAVEGYTAAFVVTMDGALPDAATVDYETSDGTATAGSDYTAVSGTLTFAAGETSKTVTVTIPDDDVHEDSEEFRLTLSNPSANARVLDAIATGRIDGAELTAEFVGVPTSHDGAAFEFLLSFSEEPDSAFSYLNLKGDGRRAGALAVANGRLERTYRFGSDHRNLVWRIRIAPDSDVADVAITLLATTDCSAANAICTDNGRPLSVPVTATVPGLAPWLAVVDASGVEGANTAVDFTVTLNRAVAETVTVDYATSDGTATAGADYTATSGTLTFAPGETRKTVSVPLLDDEVEESAETFTLTLSNASGGRAYLSDATATGTIADDDSTTPPVGVPQGDVLVSNLDRPLDWRPKIGMADTVGTSLNQRGAQVFTTGDSRDGYELTAVVLNFAFYEEIDGDNLEASLHLFGVASDPLGEKILDFENPTTYARFRGDRGPVTLVPADGTSEESRILRPNTDYVIQFALHTSGIERWFKIEATNSGAESGTDAWRIADDSHWKQTGWIEWSTRDYVMKMKVLGTRVERPLVFDAGLPVALSVAENTPAGTRIGRPFTASRTDPNAALTYSLDGPGKNDFAIDPATAQLRTKAVPDFENASEHALSIIVRDGQDSARHGLTITVLNQDEPPGSPAAPTLESRDGESLTVSWLAPANSGKPDILHYDLGYRLVGWPAGDPFRDGPQDVADTVARIPALVEGATYKVRVRATNSEGDGEWSAALLGTVPGTPPVAPSVTAVELAADESGDRAWTYGESIEARVTFNEPVSVRGSPTLWITIAGGPAPLALASGSGSATLVFEHEVTVDTASYTRIGITENSLGSTGGTIVSRATGMVADLSHEGTEPTAEPDPDETVPLTAEFQDMPESHDGSRIRFGLTFSEELSLSHLTLRDEAFEVTGGTVFGAQRKETGSNRRWTISVDPALASETVTITLPETTDCGASGAICTGDSRPLSATVTATVAGETHVPAPELTLAGASATEGGNATVDFAVTLSRAATDTVTVQYATSDGTASAGTDYTAMSGTLTFAAGDTAKTVSVPVLDDADDENDETFTLTLSNASGASLGNTTATGTIVDNDTTTATPLTATFENMPETHDGSRIRFGLTFSEDLSVSHLTLRDEAFEVNSGTVFGAQRKQPGSNRRWTISVDPDSAGSAVTIILPETTDCEASGAICTNDKRPLSHSLTDTVAVEVEEPTVPSLAVAGASATEGDAVTFTVSLSEASGQRVTVDYATSGGTAASGTDFTAASGTLTFDAGDRSKTVNVTTTDDSDNEEDETLTLTLSNASGATLGNATATGTIVDNDTAATPLTATFEDMPETHDGSRIRFGLTFSEELDVSYRTLRDHAFSVTGGTVFGAQRKQTGSNRRWTISVDPTSASDTVTITLPETTICAATGAICTADNRPLSHSLTDTVIDAASSSSSDIAGGTEQGEVEAALAAAGGITPEEAAAALFGEGRLSESQLDALDRLGNRNGRYDIGDLVAWRERCRQGTADCGGSPASPGPAGAAALLAVVPGGRRGSRGGPGGRRGAGRRRRTAAPRQALAMLFAVALAWSCTDGGLVEPAAPERAPDPGYLTVSLVTPADSRDSGVLLELEGPGIAEVRAPGFELFESRASGRHQVMVAGALRAGPVLQIRVPDRNRVSLYRVRVMQVAGEDYALRDEAEYRTVITR